jgi:hypothetical protein
MSSVIRKIFYVHPHHLPAESLVAPQHGFKHFHWLLISVLISLTFPPKFPAGGATVFSPADRISAIKAFNTLDGALGWH